jgi:2-keto-3-deoxy-L-rhamnonate aldolase RhmA
LFKRTNRLKAVLAEGHTALGTSIHEAREASVIYAMADGGLDFVLIDLEHNPQGMETVADLVAHCHAAGVTPMVRIPEVSYSWITRTLDTGCQSLFIPHIKSVADVTAAVEMAYYHPRGRRGMAMYGNGGVNYQDVTDVDEFTAWQNANLLIGLNVETREALDCLDDLFIDGIGFGIVGHQDLSQSLGIPGQLNDPRIVETRERVRAICKERGMYYGAVPPGLADIRAGLDVGADFVLYSGVLKFVKAAIREADAEMRSYGVSRPAPPSR